MMPHSHSRLLAAAACALLLSPVAMPQQNDEEVVIVGSHIRGPAYRLPNTPEILPSRGLNDRVRRNPSEVAGDLMVTARPGFSADSFLSPGIEFLSPFNLYGLGAGRTLVTVDGQRLSPAPLPLPGWRDTAASLADVPTNALSGLQLLPTGSSALYGSGAMIGVVNLATRDPFSGIELGVLSVAPEEASHREKIDLAFGLRGRNSSYYLAIDTQDAPALPATSMSWARDFQRAHPEYANTSRNGAPGSFSIIGRVADLYTGNNVSSCRPEVVDTMDDDDDSNDVITQREALCGDSAAVFGGLTAFSRLLDDGQEAIVQVDLSCEQNGGVLSEDQCLYPFGRHLRLRQEQNSERIFMSLNSKLSDGAEMRFQYGLSEHTVPAEFGPAQRTPPNPRYRSWLIPQASQALRSYLLADLNSTETYGSRPISSLEGRGLTAADLPDRDFFLQNFDRDSATAEQIMDAEEAADAAVERLMADQLVLNPSLIDLFNSGAAFIYNGNLLGSLGASLVGRSQYRRQRYAWDMEGQFGISDTYYRASVTHDRARTTTEQRDLLVQRMERALNGYAGPTCSYALAFTNLVLRSDGDSANDPNILAPGPGTNGCFHVAPVNGGTAVILNVSSAVNPVQSFPLVGGAVGPFLENWLFPVHSITRQQNSLQANFVLESGVENVGTSAWAAGLELRTNEFELTPTGFADAVSYPCTLVEPLVNNAIAMEQSPFSQDCAYPTGPFASLPSVLPDTERRIVLAGFGEWQTNLHSSLSTQLAMRLETDDHGEAVTAQSLAISWSPSAALNLNASFSRDFRFASLAQRADTTASSIYADTLKDYLLLYQQPASDSLSPESSSHTNLNLRYTKGSFLLWVRRWQYQVADTLAQEPAAIVAAAYQDAFSCTGGADANDDGICDSSASLVTAVRQRLIAADDEPSAREVGNGLQVQYSNGPDIDASGLSLHLGYSIQGARQYYGIGLNLHRLSEYRVGEYLFNGQSLGPAFDAVGLYNDGYPFGSLPSRRNTLQMHWGRDLHQVRLLAHSVAAYRDQRYDADIAGWTRADVSYSFTFPSRKVRLEFSVTNLADEAPPRALTPLGYDAQQHDPYGRTFRFGFVLKYPGYSE